MLLFDILSKCCSLLIEGRLKTVMVKYTVPVAIRPAPPIRRTQLAQSEYAPAMFESST